MLLRPRLLDQPGLRVEDVRCAGRPADWSEPEPSTGYSVVFVRRGCFRRRVDGRESVLDPAVVYFERPGQEQQVAHPHGGGDSCTAFALAPETAADLLGGDPELPAEPLFSQHTGETISRYRNRIRVRVALERLADGETSLARLAGDLGFADQAHLCRVVRSEVGHSPARLRERLTTDR